VRRAADQDDPIFPPALFARADERADLDFYAVPRLVTHVDHDAIAVGDLDNEPRPVAGAVRGGPGFGVQGVMLDGQARLACPVIGSMSDTSV